ncbi:hypothetical protein D3C81_1679980 [compost metagenome]
MLGGMVPGKEGQADRPQAQRGNRSPLGRVRYDRSFEQQVAGEPGKRYQPADATNDAAGYIAEAPVDHRIGRPHQGAAQRGEVAAHGHRGGGALFALQQDEGAAGQAQQCAQHLPPAQPTAGQHRRQQHDQ